MQVPPFLQGMLAQGLGRGVEGLGRGRAAVK